MGLMNNIFRWFIIDRLADIERFMESPLATQEFLRRQLITAAEETEWGKKYNFSNLRRYEDFQKAMPIQDYNSLKPYIDRIMRGEQNVLWHSPITWFAKSSGTTEDKSKFIPVSYEAFQECHFRAGKDMYALYYQTNPEANVIDGKALVMGGSQQVNQLNQNSHYGDLSAILTQNLPIWAEVKRAPERSIALMDDWEKKIEKMANSVLKENITNIVGVPTWTVVLIKYLFEMTGKDNLVDIWPNLQLYIHGGVSFSPYHELFHKYIRSSNMHYMETYNASEGFFGIQDDENRDDMLFLLNHGIFYEFIPIDKMDDENPEAIPLEDVKLGHSYAIIISTNSGLWRYKVGDTIRFTSTSPYRIQVTGRTTHYINAFGEELVVDNAEKAIAYASVKHHCTVQDFTAAPVYFSEKGSGAHEWLIEFENPPENIEAFINSMDEKLKQLNSDYEAKRHRNIALGMPIVHQLPKGTFYNWMKKRGKLGGQNKVPRLANHRKFVEEIMDFGRE
ncbi:MAG: GH3 auxin-responsive promoter family protein [Bacteroidetes bacterium]|nr:GH3 auxin-responsive promoter family protein [Bacteroidota bacterium]